MSRIGDIAKTPVETDGMMDVSAGGTSSESETASPVKAGAAGTPSPLIMCSDLPERCTQEMLSALFKQFKGVCDIRLISGKNVAFVEFENDRQSEVALCALQGFRLSKTDSLRLSYAK